MLAGLEPAKLDDYLATAELKKVHDRTLTDRDQLRTELEVVARQGCAYVDSQLEEGLLAVGVPIRDRNGRIIAAANLSTHPSRRSMSDLQEILLLRQDAIVLVCESVEKPGNLGAMLRTADAAVSPRR